MQIYFCFKKFFAFFLLRIFILLSPNSRGGVEDTRLEAKAKDSLSEDRHSRGQGQECSRPRTKDTSASALQKKKKSSQKFFSRSPKKKKKKKVFTKIFQALHKILTFQKIVLSSRAEDRPIFEDLRPRGQGQGLDLRGQGLQNVSSRTPSLPNSV